MQDESIGATAKAHTRALRAEYIRQQIAFIDVEFTTALTFLARAAAEREAGHPARVIATTEQAQIAYDSAVTHLAAAGLSAAEQAPLETRRRAVADRFAQQLLP